MAMIPIFLEFSIECSSCRQPLPVNRAAEQIQCRHCQADTDTPVEFWQALVTPNLLEATTMEPESDSWAKGMHAAIGTYRIDFGRREPRCPECRGAWDIEELLKIAEQDGTRFTCGDCGRMWSLRRPPEWFGQVIPFATLLVAETAAEEDRESLRGAASISIHCYHCGGSLPLDGSSRSVRCRYCSGEFLVPDEIWARLHPVVTARPWYVVLDLGEGAALLPGDIDEFIDLAGLPGDDTALLWEEESEYCIGRVDRTGLLRWAVRDILCSGYARLHYVPESDTLWVLDHDEEAVHAFHAGTGKNIRTIENEEGDPGLISVLDHDGIAACRDNTLLVYRQWEKDTSPDTISSLIRRRGPHVLTKEEIDRLNEKSGLWEIRRFDEKGKRVPLWPGKKDDEPDHSIPRWDSMPDFPAQPPDSALLECGPDGTLYMMEPAAAVIARYSREGKHLGLIRPRQKVVATVEDFCVADDGTVFIVFQHRKQIGRENWSHIARIGSDGSFQVLVGPHAPAHNYSIGTWARRISISPQGSIHVCAYGLRDLRVLNPDGSTLWKGLWTPGYDRDLAEELEEARKKRSGGRE